MGLLLHQFHGGRSIKEFAGKMAVSNGVKRRGGRGGGGGGVQGRTQDRLAEAG